MSIEAHPNINAAGFTVEIITGFQKHLRGKAAADATARINAVRILNKEIVEFVTKISILLDEKFGI